MFMTSLTSLKQAADKAYRHQKPNQKPNVKHHQKHNRMMPGMMPMLPMLGLMLSVWGAMSGWQAPSCQAALLNYTVTLNTTDLEGFDTQQPFSLDFVLNNANNATPATPSSATLDSFTFGSAPSSEPAPGATGTPFTFGQVQSGSNLNSTVKLTENSGAAFDSEFSQNFNPGSLLSFNLAADNRNSGGLATATPDSLSFLILNRSNNPIATFDAAGNPSSGNQLFTISFNQDGSQSVQSFGFRDAAGTTTFFATVTPTAVPEPQTWAMFALGLGAILWTLRRRKLPQLVYARPVSSPL